MSKTEEEFRHRVGDFVVYGDTGRIAHIIDFDATDETLPWLLRYFDGGQDWAPDNKILPLTQRDVDRETRGGRLSPTDAEKINLGGMSADDLMDVANDPRDWINVATATDTGLSLAHGVETGTATLADIQRLSKLLAVQLNQAGQPKTAKGTCTKCMGDVTFDTTTGKWMHDASTSRITTEAHAVPAVIPGASDE